jgi:hypothetical protein
VDGATLTFTDGVGALAAGDSIELTFDVDVTAGASDVAQVSRLDVRFTDPFKGEKVNDSRIGLAQLAVAVAPSEVPVIDGPLAEGATRVSGTIAEAEGTEIRLFVNGLEVGTTSSDASGDWMVSDVRLFGGQRVSASAIGPGKLESRRSDELVVAALGGTTACNDGIDNDGDGLTDFGADPGCASLRDDDESGPAACNDGDDNDGDGLSDLDDPGCEDANDVSETDIRACADGLDNDDDGQIDFPRDRGCASALDDDENAHSTGGSGSGSGSGAGAMTANGGMAGIIDGGVGDPTAGADGGAAGSSGSGELPDDPGGVVRPSGGSGGCGCRVGAPANRPAGLAWSAIALLIGATVARRRRRI